MNLLLVAVLAGLGAGIVRARIKGERYDIAPIRLAWLVPIAYFPQFIVFQSPGTTTRIPLEFSAAALVSSQLLLLLFAWFNRKQPGFWLLSLGLALNLTVIISNGGFMPISPETIARFRPEIPTGLWSVGERFGTGKDIILANENIRFGWLADRFLFPAWSPFRAAYSMGDIFIAVGAFWFLWSGSQHNDVTDIRR